MCIKLGIYLIFLTGKRIYSNSNQLNFSTYQYAHTPRALFFLNHCGWRLTGLMLFDFVKCSKDDILICTHSKNLQKFYFNLVLHFNFWAE